MSTAVRALSLLLTALVMGVATTAARHTPMTAPGAAATVVVAELFTSEGCSSCPAADDLLREWLATQPVPGVQIVGLSEHVDYWDRLGWRDPFSSSAFSARQSTYDTAVFRDNRVYTPQLVVDGRLEVIGSDASAVPLPASWSRPNLRLVALLQERDSRRILGAATAALETATARFGGQR